MIVFNNVSYKAANGKNILNQISAEIVSHKTAVIGLNGSGKSTFARLINGLKLPSSGYVEIDGLIVTENLKEVRKKVGFIFQNPENQIVMPTVAEDLAFGLQNLGYDQYIIEKEVSEILKELSLEHLKDTPCYHLSGGEKQILAIASVLIMKPEYIIFDEPTTQLDIKNKAVIMDLILKLQQKIIFVTHDMETLELFDFAIFMKDGQIEKSGKPEEVKKHYLNQYG